MKRTITTLFAILAVATLASTAVANGCHDESPHGHNAKVAAAQKAEAAKPATLAVGPRAQDNPLRFVTVKSVQATAPQRLPKSR